MEAKNVYYLTREDAIEAMTRMINMAYDNRPREFEIKMTAGVDRIPMVELHFDGIIARDIIGKEK